MRQGFCSKIYNLIEVYNLIEIMQKNPKECRNLFVIGDDDMVDAHYISNLAAEMSESGSPKQKKETEILDFFQDFLQELDGMYCLHVCIHSYSLLLLL
ncbi:unnamed protein product [Oncorhynchus mykiss]|uniref:Uncharacterized protein n=1 Tax=Oncorhynchus mykiss TaxID=8022 RepID=A0A060W2D2_ONCMY|nr:unnamed protein product [Oncorhynchus mykiss]